MRFVMKAQYTHFPPMYPFLREHVWEYRVLRRIVRFIVEENSRKERACSYTVRAVPSVLQLYGNIAHSNDMMKMTDVPSQTQVQLAVRAGARVVGSAGTKDGMDAVRAAGAHDVVNHREDGYLDAAVSEGEFDLVLEMAAPTARGWWR